MKVVYRTWSWISLGPILLYRLLPACAVSHDMALVVHASLAAWISLE